MSLITWTDENKTKEVLMVDHNIPLGNMVKYRTLWFVPLGESLEALYRTLEENVSFQVDPL